MPLSRLCPPNTVKVNICVFLTCLPIFSIKSYPDIRMYLLSFFTIVLHKCTFWHRAWWCGCLSLVVAGSVNHCSENWLNRATGITLLLVFHKSIIKASCHSSREVLFFGYRPLSMALHCVLPFWLFLFVVVTNSRPRVISKEGTCVHAYTLTKSPFFRWGGQLDKWFCRRCKAGGNF